MSRPKPYHIIWNKANPNDVIKSGDGYVIHHKDFNRNNNDISNLIKMTKSEHRILHMTGENHFFFGKHHTKESREKMSLAKIGTKQSEELKKKKSILNSGKGNPFYGKHHSKETRELISKLSKGRKLSEEHKKKLYGRIPWNKGKKIKLTEATKLKMALSQQLRRKREAEEKEET